MASVLHLIPAEVASRPAMQPDPLNPRSGAFPSLYSIPKELPRTPSQNPLGRRELTLSKTRGALSSQQCASIAAHHFSCRSSLKDDAFHLDTRMRPPEFPRASARRISITGKTILPSAASNTRDSIFYSRSLTDSSGCLRRRCFAQFPRSCAARGILGLPSTLACRTSRYARHR